MNTFLHTPPTHTFRTHVLLHTDTHTSRTHALLHTDFQKHNKDPEAHVRVTCSCASCRDELFLLLSPSA